MYLNNFEFELMTFCTFFIIIFDVFKTYTKKFYFFNIFYILPNNTPNMIDTLEFQMNVLSKLENKVNVVLIKYKNFNRKLFYNIK